MIVLFSSNLSERGIKKLFSFSSNLSESGNKKLFSLSSNLLERSIKKLFIFLQIFQKGANFVFVAIPNDNSDIYAAVKKRLCVEDPIPSQVVTVSKVLSKVLFF
jgi:hypothetical protein